jgi:hypothetical protein
MMLKDELRKTPVQLGILFGTLVLFLITNQLLRDNAGLNFIPIIFALMIAVEIGAFVLFEVKEGADKRGWKHEIVDTIIMLAAAVAIWLAAGFILNTSSPVSAVVSCSMLPSLQRGDFVVVQGSPVRAYDISMTEAELASLNDRAFVTYPDGNASLDGSLMPYCVAERLAGKTSALCHSFINSPESVIEKKGAFTYRYETCATAYSNGTGVHGPCLKSVTFRGNGYLTNFSDDVIVYQPLAGDYYSLVGDIVHRALFRINVDGKYYYLTRGDNNPIIDLQAYGYGSGMMNHPIPQSNVRGKVIGRIPYLGYLKLFINGYFQEDPQCKTQLTFSSVN